MHITCRSWHRSAKEDYRANQMMEVQVWLTTKEWLEAIKRGEDFYE
jgi:hypothetical protein